MTTTEALTTRLARLRAHCALASLPFARDIEADDVHQAGAAVG